MLFRVLSLTALFCGLASANLGVDYATAVSVSDIQCMVNAGYDYFIPRVWHSYGGFDSGSVDNINNAWQGGASNVHGYMFPCATKSPSAQASQLAGNLTESNVDVGYIFLDIESNPSTGCGWSSDTSNNCEFIKTVLSTLKDRGVQRGVYASEYEWTNIAGSDCDVGSYAETPLWWATYNGQASLSGFTAFGGWDTPFIHQFDDQPSVCGVGVDHNYAAGSTSAPGGGYNPPAPVPGPHGSGYDSYYPYNDGSSYPQTGSYFDYYYYPSYYDVKAKKNKRKRMRMKKH